MTVAGRFERVETLFRAASGLGETECERFLHEQCGDDHSLLQELRGMLRADKRPPGVLDHPALGHDLLHTSFKAHGRAPGALPERIGAYRIIRLIGEGGMGTVYEAQQDNPARRVALKVIRAGLISPQVARRFRQEAQILGRLQHPGIALILEAGAVGEGADVRPFLAMELVHGLSLLHYADTHHLGVRQRVEIVVELCNAVQHAHDHGVIHRDLKPGNILVGVTGQPKILDFGVARATSSDVQAQTLSQTLHTTAGELIGTVPYMSPEQASGDPAQIDWRSDVYALGVILFELLSGRLPHEVRDRMVHEALRIIRESDATRLGSVNRTFRGDLETIADKALANDKQRRYQSAADLAADLRRYLANQPITARPASTLYQLRKFARRNRALVSGVAAGLLLLLAGTAVAVWQAVAATRAQALAEKASDRADVRAAEALRQAYRATIAAASAALDAHDPTTARQQLMVIAQADRNWEWRHLYAKLDQSSAQLDAAGPALAVAPAADNQHVVSVTKDGRILLTSVTTGEVTRALQLDMSAVTDAAVSDDGLHVAVAWSPGNNVGVAHVNGDGTVRPLGQAPGGVSMLAIAPGGKHVAALYGHHVALWNCLRPAPPALADAGGYWGLARFSRDGQRLAIACQLKMSVLDVATGKVMHSKVLNNAGGGADLSADNTQFMTGGPDKKVHVIDPSTGRDLETYSGHMGPVTRVALSPDEIRIASAGNDGTLRIWQRGIDTPLAVLHMPSACSSLQFLPDGTRLLTRHGNEVRLWRADADDPDLLRAHGSYVYGVTFTPDGSRLVSGAWDRTLRVWDTRTRECLKVLDCGPVGDPYVTSVAISSDGRTIAAGHHKGGGQHSHIRLWNLDTGELQATLPKQLGEVRALAFTPNGDFLASGRTAAPLTLWSMRDPSSPPEFLRDIGVVRGIAFSPDGGTLATTHDDGCIRLWDFATRALIRELRGHASNCTTCQFSPDGRLIASAAKDARLWDVATGTCLAVLDRHWDVVYAVAFSPDGTRLATGSRDTTIRIWDVAFGEEVAQLRGHANYVYALAFSPDGGLLASASGDSTVRLWHTRGNSQPADHEPTP